MDRATVFMKQIDIINGALFWNIKKIISKGDYLYALVPEHPNSTKNGYVLAHRVIMENHLGRLLNTDEIIHHIDGNKKNNLINNLEIMNYKSHCKHHANKRGCKYVTLQCPWCKKIFNLPKNQSFIQKPNKYNCNCCSTKCRGKLYKFIQINGVTEQVETAISGNLLSEYIKYSEDNPEETNL